ncbi:hypothetical protein OBBRIDRAFT_793578 [Obba rivulosa]|uniref:Uncharacterized protein n=1 Tax=Obba rivulosa TaxID=1052685 RepID=A0A8E2DK63_9APHY|nr:hypothetical protein OBBRIDRAFT_793578 [Obba rivulosa]
MTSPGRQMMQIFVLSIASAKKEPTCSGSLRLTRMNDILLIDEVRHPNYPRDHPIVILAFRASDAVQYCNLTS